MPGLLSMDSGATQGVRTDHDRDEKIRAMEEAAGGSSQNAPDLTAAKANAQVAVNGVGQGEQQQQQQQQQQQMKNTTISNPSSELSSRMNDLPDELVHITQGFVPLSTLLTRLAQLTHNSLQEKVSELAKMPVPAAAINGNVSHSNSGPDDVSNDNLRKKAALLNWAQDFHAKWIKALVIAEWSRKSHLVSKLIDLKFHLDQQRFLYDAALDNIVNVKRDLTFARLPSPDLKTALQVLSTGVAPWLPDLQYIEPQPLTLDQRVRWMDELDTQLSLRLNMEDYDRIPFHFRNYKISSGRVQFRVPGEFEVDLTIADENPEKQFWFIDFRFGFQPAPSSIPDSLRMYLESCVNEALLRDGLQGCYQFLHEFVLTSKINELRHQALELSRNAWTGSLVVEQLHRALAIQYWTSKTEITGLKSWVLVAINSGEKKTPKDDSKCSSFLEATWYRDGKAMKDVELTFDEEALSAGDLLKNVVGRHIEYLLSVVYKKMLGTPRYKNQDSGMTLSTSPTEPATSALHMHLGKNIQTSLSIEPTTGFFAIKPSSLFTIPQVNRLNNGKTPAEDGMVCLEHVRCAILEDELQRRCSINGWHSKVSPLNVEETRQIMKGRDWTRILWLQKGGWASNWYIAIFFGLGGDEWLLVDSTRDERVRGPPSYHKLPGMNSQSGLSECFWHNLAVFTTGVITQLANVRELRQARIRCRQIEGAAVSAQKAIQLRSLEISLSSILPGAASSERSANASDSQLAVNETTRDSSHVARTGNHHWAHDFLSLRYGDVLFTGSDGRDDQVESQPKAICYAIIKVRRPAKYESLKDVVDETVAYDSQLGQFTLRLVYDVGSPFVPILVSRVQAVDRFVNFLEAVEKAKGTITSERVTLKSIVFSYTALGQLADSKRWRATLDLSGDRISVSLEKENPHLLTIDLMRSLVNSTGGIACLIAWLPRTLPMVEALEKIRSGWDDIEAGARGRIEFSMRAIDWMTIRYTLPKAAPKKGQPNRKMLSLQAKLQTRRGELWWHLSRTEMINDDDFSPMLKAIWETSGKDWLGLSSGAAARPGQGLIDMLRAVDDTVRVMVSSATPRMKNKAANN